MLGKALLIVNYCAGTCKEIRLREQIFARSRQSGMLLGGEATIHCISDLRGSSTDGTINIPLYVSVCVFFFLQYYISRYIPTLHSYTASLFIGVHFRFIIGKNQVLAYIFVGRGTRTSRRVGRNLSLIHI